ncbi:MAG TPA: CHRD domain-containing protein [Gaiellaceae bacterium]|nr:CHRD domain-containing protein [Gaiellaceae bacterium]
MKRLFIAIVAAVPALLAGAAVTAQGEGAPMRIAAAPSKLTICHETGSESNPWRRIAVSSRALTKPKSTAGRLLRAHLRHTGDVVVAGTAACPPASETPAPTITTAPTRVTICHKTGSGSNPYRRITVSSRAVTHPSSSAGKTLRGHMRHTGDLLLPGANACPSGSEPGQGVKLTATLQPGQGATGSGTAAITIRLGLDRLCAKLVVTGLTDVTGAHIHRVGTGAMVVPLTAPTAGTSSGCTTVEKAVLQQIVRTPGGYYVNVHTATYPDGQIQGRLTR